MNLTEEKKEPLRRQPIENKRNMLLMQHKGVRIPFLQDFDIN